MNSAHVSSPLPSLQALRVLEAAVRLQSYTVAAHEVGVTHGAVSRQVAALEGWTGSRLFERRGRRMAPTEEALRLVTQSREALRILADAFGHPLLPAPVTGLRLSTTHAIARLWLLPRLPALHATHPGLLAALETSTSLDAGWTPDIDVALRYGPGRWPGVRAEFLGGERSFPVASPTLAAVHEDWRDAPLLSSPFQSWRAWFEAAGLTPPSRSHSPLELADAGLVLDAAAAGLGVALARERLAAPLLARGEITRLTAQHVEDSYGYYLVWSPDTPRLEEIRHLLQYLRSGFQADQGIG